MKPLTFDDQTSCTALGDRIYVFHPDHPPITVRSDGERYIIEKLVFEPIDDEDVWWEDQSAEEDHF